MPNHHDAGYKELFSYPELVKQLMEGFAPPEISQLLDYTTLKQHPGNYITPLFDEQIEDVVWSVQLKPESPDQFPVTLYLYILLEFQSTVDPAMPLRILHYTASFYHQLLKDGRINLRKDKLPPVFPVVLYNGEPAWQITQEMQQLIHAVPAFLKAFQPSQRHYLVDEQGYSFEELDQNDHPISGAFALEKSREAQEIFNSLVSLFRRALQHPDAARILPIFKRWSQRHLHHHAFDINLEHILSLEELTTMLATKFDYITEKSRQQGIEQGRLETAKNLLKLGVLSDQQIAQAAGLPLEKILALKAQNPR